MINYYNKLIKDVRFVEGLNACMNCGVCTAICPAAEFYRYDPRIIADLVQSRDNEKIEELLKSETIWYCGQCMSCRTRCPRGNTPGYIIMALRKLSQELGFFTESEKGRQQYAIMKAIGSTILNYGYCVHPDIVTPENHPEQGPVWKWVCDNKQEVYDRMGANYNKTGSGALRKISDEVLDELKNIFDETGATDFFNIIEEHSIRKAKEMGFSELSVDQEYFNAVYCTNNEEHEKEF